eukprot:scaffold98038_cov35-Tisochrysis_lutea.AAC.1
MATSSFLTCLAERAYLARLPLINTMLLSITGPQRRGAKQQRGTAEVELPHTTSTRKIIKPEFRVRDRIMQTLGSVKSAAS